MWNKPKGAKTNTDSYQMWGWRSSSTEPPLSGAVLRIGSRTPTETGRNAPQWPRLDSAEPPRPNTAPERRRAERSAWRVGKHTPRSQTSSHNKIHRCRSVTEKRARWRSAYVFSHHSLHCFCASSWECLTRDIRFDLVFKIIVIVPGDARKIK